MKWPTEKRAFQTIKPRTAKKYTENKEDDDKILRICIEKGMGYPKRISIVSIVNYFRTKTNNQQPKSIFKRTKQRKELVTRTFSNPLDFTLILLKNRITNLEKKKKHLKSSY